MDNFSTIRKNILLCHDTDDTDELKYIKDNFHGTVVTDLDTFTIIPGAMYYLCGDIAVLYPMVQQKVMKHYLKDLEPSVKGPKDHEIINHRVMDHLLVKSLNHDNRIVIIQEFSKNYKPDAHLISSGEVPVNIHNAGVYFRKFFVEQSFAKQTKDYFNSIRSEHKFQSLTESDKPGSAYRKGIYLTHVKNESDDTLGFNLLRCSSNFEGPTDNFRNTDHKIIGRANNACKYLFNDPAELNHVLAQIYYNGANDGNKKAKIKAHSDKTKDMPDNGILAFCTFYDSYNNGVFTDLNPKITREGYDYLYKGISILTKLRFRLKDIDNPAMNQMVKQFDVTLYPDSMFVIPLSTNRAYTHEIVPSSLDIGMIPTRMGYVIRCSDTQAIYNDNDKSSYIRDGDKMVRMIPMTLEERQRLKDTYYKENKFTKKVTYDKFYSSMNRGDYEKPMI